MALSLAKQKAGSQLANFEPAMEEALRESQRLHTALRRAVARAQFTLAYQPQVDLKTGAIIGAEALAPTSERVLWRWVQRTPKEKTACCVRLGRARGGQ